ncbi:exodeoxyribonuclease III [Mitsuokella sp. oral taxon 131]|uniref:exodeoxyribonuclease III n=1 Tax=Mitsuokella sp. oral taxon 131 TaxID=1321780 RepID=UPI00058DBC3F|nr:exodeoxyribonuclease III [Mitsuokella sp. oral taxon 131]
MKLISWNVNGLRACLKKGFMESFLQLDADIFALQETKMQPEQAILDLPGYTQYWNSAEKKGYSGTAVFSRVKPLDVINGIGIEEHDHEGRVITLEFPSCFFVTVYTPNSKRGLERLSYRMEWEDAFRAYVKKLDDAKPVIICGDLNVAHTEMDLKNPKTNHHNAGFTNEERAKFTELLNSGFIDTFRTLYPTRTAVYTWWSYLRKARDTNAGWRIDYFVASTRFREFILDATIHNEIFGSDHCPVGLEIATSI